MAILYSEKELQGRAEVYAETPGLSIVRFLGKGMQELVFETTGRSAVKIHARDAGFKRELAAYHRLSERQVSVVQGLSLPRLHAFSEELLAIEISIVQPPYLLDFGGAYLDAVPEHARYDSEWQEEKEEQFGEDWARVQAVIQ